MIWSASDDLSLLFYCFFNYIIETNILTSTFMRGTYAPPTNFCFDNICLEDPIIDNPKLQGYNLDEKISQFIEYIKLEVNKIFII